MGYILLRAPSILHWWYITTCITKRGYGCMYVLYDDDMGIHHESMHENSIMTSRKHACNHSHMYHHIIFYLYTINKCMHHVGWYAYR